MKLFTKEIDKKLAAQYHLGADLNAQVVVAKIFNPYGNGRWYLINSDPADPDYLWAIVQIGNIVEVGSVSRRELETLRVGRFGFPLERDLGFSQRNAQEVYNGVKGGKTYADGGVADEVTNYAVGGLTPGRWYKDMEGVEYKFIGKVDSGPNKDQLLFTDGEKKMYKNIDDFGEKPKENKLFSFFAKGGEVLKKYGFETIDDAVKALKNGEISTTKFMDILYEYEKKSKRKLEDGGYMADGGVVKEGLYYVGYNKGRGQGKGVFKDSYSSYKEAEKEVEKIEKLRGGLYGNMVAYYVSDKDGNFVRNENRLLESKMADGGMMAKGGEIDMDVIVKTPKGIVTKKDFGGFTKKQIIEWCEERGWVYNPKGEKLGGRILKEYEFFIKSPTKYNVTLPNKMADGGATHEKFGYHVINKNATLKDGTKVFVADGTMRYPHPDGVGVPGIYYSVTYPNGEQGYERWADLVFSKNKMAMGGTTKFADKVKSIQKSLLKRKKVAPSVQKDYGKTYNKAEAKESATRIVGAMTAKERLMVKKKMADGGLVSMKPEYKKLMQLEDRARSSSYKAKNYMKWTETTGENFRRRWNKMVLKLRGFNDTEGKESLANTKKEWLEYCKENNLVYNYNFGDILA